MYYCGKCGSKLSLVEKITRDKISTFPTGVHGNRFNTATGKEQFYLQFACPNYKSFLGFNNGHTTRIEESN